MTSGGAPAGGRTGGAGRRPIGSVVVAVTSVAAAVGLVIVAVGPWRVGLSVVGAAMVLTALARIALPDRHIGLLRIRRTGSDVVVMVTLGVTITLLAWLVPDQPGL